MPDEQPVISPAAIRAESAWLRRLSVALIGAGDGADDAIQETWLAGLAHPPAAPRSLRGWLRVVLRNVARKRARSEVRRRAREGELAATSRSDTPSSEELAVRVEAQRLVADLVVGLDEPYRSTVILCYYEGLAPAEVARRLDIPAGTVRWRLSNALGLLRAQLDARYASSRRSWRALLLPVAAPPTTAGGAGGKEAVAMSFNMTSKAALVTTAALGALAVGGLAVNQMFGAAGAGAAGPPKLAGTALDGGVRRGEVPGRPRGEGTRVRLPRFIAPHPAAEKGSGQPPPDRAAMSEALDERMREAAERVKICMKRWVTVDESLKSGVRLTLHVDAMGLQDVWVEDRSDVPSGSLGCLSEAVYQTDWSDVTATPLKAMYTVKYERSDGGPP